MRWQIVASIGRAKPLSNSVYHDIVLKGLMSGLLASPANDIDSGFACAISLKFASHSTSNNEAGMKMINLPTTGVDYQVPFVSCTNRAAAREEGVYAKEFLTTVKSASA